MNELLMLPGPTNIPPEGLAAQKKQMIGHREEQFSELLKRITTNLKEIFMTKNDILIFSASGTGGLESAVVNTFSPGDTVLSISNGLFANRFREIAQTFGVDIIELDFPWGGPCNYEKIEEYLNNYKKIKAVLFTHNETSTGVQNDLKKMSELLKDRDILFIVDAVSSLGGIPIETDNWGIDIVITSSQKALMTPPGLAILSVSPRAWNQIEKSTLPKFYWDLLKARKYYNQSQQTPYTSPVSLLYALDASLKLILNEGLSNVFQRHELLTLALRQGLEALGLKPFVPREIASYTASSFYQPEGIKFSSFKERLLKKYGLHIAGGQGELKEKIFRLGHMGYFNQDDIIRTVESIGFALRDFAHNAELYLALNETKKTIKKGLLK
jgi:aspartate aminotransferase-like enzyme